MVRKVKYHYNQKWLGGAGMTLPLFGNTHIFFKSATPSQNLVNHELCHAEQIERLGGMRYIWQHIWWRIKTRSLYAKSSPLEWPCYRAQYPDLSEEELRAWLNDSSAVSGGNPERDDSGSRPDEDPSRPA